MDDHDDLIARATIKRQAPGITGAEMDEAMRRRAQYLQYLKECAANGKARAQIQSLLQPIETAPKDGRQLLLFSYRRTWGTVGGKVERVYWLSWAGLGFWVKDLDNWNEGSRIQGLREPTHWVPLPETPKLPKEDE